MTRTLTLLVALLATACGSADTAPSAPEPTTATKQAAVATCKAVADNPDLVRQDPLAVPSALADIAHFERTTLAVLSLSGATICVDTGWMEEAELARLSDDGRFIDFAWRGYEAFGHVLVDRAGTGAAVDTGTAPAFSPDRHHVAAVDLDESGFGALGAFAVWEVTPDRLKQVQSTPVDEQGGIWSMRGWRGDDCLELSVERLAGEESAGTSTQTYHASVEDNWQPAPGGCTTPDAP